MVARTLSQLALVFASLLLSHTAQAKRRWSVGVAIADPFGVSAKRPLADRFALQMFAGWRLLGNDDDYQFPGPLAGADLIVHTPQFHGISLYGGAGAGAGFVRAGCYYDSVADFCVDSAAPSLIFRAPLGIALQWGRLELTFEATPSYRVMPEAHHTFLGGFAVRWSL